MPNENIAGLLQAILGQAADEDELRRSQQVQQNRAGRGMPGILSQRLPSSVDVQQVPDRMPIAQFLQQQMPPGAAAATGPAMSIADLLQQQMQQQQPPQSQQPGAVEQLALQRLSRPSARDMPEDARRELEARLVGDRRVGQPVNGGAGIMEMRGSNRRMNYLYDVPEGTAGSMPRTPGMDRESPYGETGRLRLGSYGGPNLTKEEISGAMDSGAQLRRMLGEVAGSSEANPNALMEGAVRLEAEKMAGAGKQAEAMAIANVQRGDFLASLDGLDINNGADLVSYMQQAEAADAAAKDGSTLAQWKVLSKLSKHIRENEPKLKNRALKPHQQQMLNQLIEMEKTLKKQPWWESDTPQKDTMYQPNLINQLAPGM